MKNPPIRSPRERVAGLSHFARMLDKIRLEHAGQLPDEYRPNLGFIFGLDGHLCGFLGIEYAALRDRVREGGTDDEIAEWCFAHGSRPSTFQKRIWNEFARKFGWNDRARAFLAKVREDEGVGDRTDLATAFDLIDFIEGRDNSKPAEGEG